MFIIEQFASYKLCDHIEFFIWNEMPSNMISKHIKININADDRLSKMNWKTAINRKESYLSSLTLTFERLYASKAYMRLGGDF